MSVKLILFVIYALTMNILVFYMYRNNKGCIVTLMKAFSIFITIGAIVVVILAVVYGCDDLCD
ncbi:hypothetical protein [Lysinibacillus xylanilyticus]|uniref:hypothetical protein n=1 Tax=Lysinibacillus xylanilyticus TaxID=582475 RepID=UPI003CFD2DC8